MHAFIATLLEVHAAAALVDAQVGPERRRDVVDILVRGRVRVAAELAVRRGPREAADLALVVALRGREVLRVHLTARERALEDVLAERGLERGRRVEVRVPLGREGRERVEEVREVEAALELGLGFRENDVGVGAGHALAKEPRARLKDDGRKEGRSEFERSL